MSAAADPKQVVMSCVNAINREDFAAARQFVADDLSFVGVLGSRQGGDVYFKDMERMRLKYDVKKVFADADDVCLFYNLAIAGANVLVSAWYHVVNGKICSLQVVFDPRPILEAQSKSAKSS